MTTLFIIVIEKLTFLSSYLANIIIATPKKNIVAQNDLHFLQVDATHNFKVFTYFYL